MKTIQYFLPVCICLCLTACTGNSEPEEEIEIEEPCPDLADVNPRFVYGDIPYYSERLAYMGMERPADSYNYPVYPGMDGSNDRWYAATDSGWNIRQACQVMPECLLKKMSTQAVIQAIWEMPNLEGFSGREPYLQRNIETMRTGYNAFEELYNRKDGGLALFERLKLVDPLTPFLRSESQILELLLSRPDFISQMSESEKRKTVEITLSNDFKRYGEWVAGGYNIILRPAAWILMGNTMHSAGYVPLLDAMNENEELKYFIEGWRPNSWDSNKRDAYWHLEYYYGNIPQIITDFAKKYIND